MAHQSPMLIGASLPRRYTSRRFVIARGVNGERFKHWPIRLRSACREAAHCHRGHGQKLSGLGNTTIWLLIQNRTLQTVHVGRRRLIVFRSLEALLAPRSQPQPRRGRPAAQHAAGRSHDRWRTHIHVSTS